MSEGNVRLNGEPLDPATVARIRAEVDWSWQLDHGSLEACRELHEGFAVNPDYMQRFLEALHDVLPAEQGRYAVFGCYAFNCYNVPRETHDIDITIAAREFDAFLDALGPAIVAPLELSRSPRQVSVFFPGRRAPKLADLVLAEANPVLDAALNDPRATRRIHVPRFGEAWTLAPEAIVAAKYYSASDPMRARRRIQDVFDMAETFSQAEIQPLDRGLIRKLVATIPIPRAAEIFERIMRDLDGGKIPRFPWGALDE